MLQTQGLQIPPPQCPSLQRLKKLCNLKLGWAFSHVSHPHLTATGAQTRCPVGSYMEWPVCGKVRPSGSALSHRNSEQPLEEVTGLQPLAVLVSKHMGLRLIAAHGRESHVPLAPARFCFDLPCNL